MPGQPGYFDTPVVPVQAFSEGYNHPDCALPDSTPAVASVVNSAANQLGPWVTNGHGATDATAAFTVSGVARCTTASCANPSSITFPHGVVTCTATGVGGPNCSANFGFGRANTVNCAAGQACVALLGSDGNKYPLTNVAWSDTTITGSVATTAGTHTLPNCAVSQQAIYGGSTTKCGQLVITTAAGKT